MKDNYTENELNEIVEELSDLQREQYIEQTRLDTPDLWGRIEAGFEAELTELQKQNDKKIVDINTKRKLKNKYRGLVAAAVLLIVIALPVAFLNMGGTKKSSDEVWENIGVEGNDKTEMYEATESALESDAEMCGEETGESAEMASEPEAGQSLENDIDNSKVDQSLNIFEEFGEKRGEAFENIGSIFVFTQFVIFVIITLGY